MVSLVLSQPRNSIHYNEDSRCDGGDAAGKASLPGCARARWWDWSLDDWCCGMKATWALIRRARKECQRLVVSIYVNPTRFGPKEDLAKYPRPREKDLASVPQGGRRSRVRAGESLSAGPLDLRRGDGSVCKVAKGVSRPGHFRGVATVVLKLFNSFGRRAGDFGEKDAQQVASSGAWSAISTCRLNGGRADRPRPGQRGAEF